MRPIFYSRPNLAFTCHDRFSWFGVLGRRCRAYLRFLWRSRLSIRLCALTHRFRYRRRYACSSFSANETADTGPPSPTIVFGSRGDLGEHISTVSTESSSPKVLRSQRERVWSLTPFDIWCANANAIAKARIVPIGPVTRSR